jgi:ketosteroid isomerase-like protein
MQANNQNERLAMDFFTTLSTGDLEALRVLLHEDASWTPMVRGVPGEGTHVGRSAIIDSFLAPVRGLFKPGDPKVLVDTIASNGALVLTETRGVGTLSDGRPYENRYAWAIEIKDGRIFAVREYMDSLYVMKLFEKPSA